VDRARTAPVGPGVAAGASRDDLGANAADRIDDDGVETVALKRELRELRQKLDEASDTNADLEAKLARLQSSLANTSRDRDEASRRSGAAQERMGEEISRLRSLVDRYEADGKAKDVAHASVCESVRVLTAKTASYSQTQEVLERDRELLKTELGSVHNDLQKSREELKEAHVQAGSLKSQLEVVHGDLQSSKGQLEAALRHVEPLRDQVASLKMEKAATEARADRLKDGGDAAAVENRRLASELEASRQALQRCVREVENERRGMAEVGSQAEALGERIRELESSISACWLHGFCIRINRVTKPRRRAAREILA